MEDLTGTLTRGVMTSFLLSTIPLELNSGQKSWEYLIMNLEFQ